MTRYAIGLGSNQGDRLAHLRFGHEELTEIGTIVSTSPLYETEPVGGPEQPPFLNAVVVFEAELAPSSLLSELQRIEAEAGRARTIRWGPRTLDLDIVAASGEPIAGPELEIPHPRADQRRFVLEPLAEIWPEADVGGRSAAAALAELPDQGVDRLRTDWADDRDRWLGVALVTVQFAWFAAIGLTLVLDGSVPDRIDVTTVAGLVLALVGVGLAVQASRRLGPGLTASPEPVDGGQLVDSGPYAYSRHPIYGGIGLFMFGASAVLQSLPALALSVGLLGFFYLKAGYEERRLRVRYAGYRSYMLRVRSRLIPFLL